MQKTELSPGGWGPYITGFPHWVSVLGTHLYQCNSWHCCERLCQVSVNIFEDSFNAFALLMGDLLSHLPTPCWMFSSFWSKTAWPSCSTLSVHPVSPQVSFLFPQIKNVLKGKHFADVEEVKQKNGRRTKRHQNRQAQKTWAVEKKSRSVVCIRWRVLWRWVKFKHVRINTQFLINKFQFWGYPLV